MKKYFAIIVLLSLFLSGCKNEINSFDECVAAGNPTTKSIPAQCIADGKTFVQDIDQAVPEPIPKINCTEEEKAAEACTLEYAPVCGDDGITYGNKCAACASGSIDYYSTGECGSIRQEVFCTSEQRDVDTCPKIYGPVCAKVNVQCVRAPCPPIEQTFSNPCDACRNHLVDSYSAGECMGEQLIGGQRDEHGCLGPAGYSWDEGVGACTRSWELDESQKEAAKIAVSPLSYSVTVTQVDALRCLGCFIVYYQRNDNEERFKATLTGLEVVSSSECSCPQLTPPAPGWCDEGIIETSVDGCGCSRPVCARENLLGSDCGTVSPDSRDECCERSMVGSPSPTCIGNWTYSLELSECEYICDE